MRDLNPGIGQVLVRMAMYVTTTTVEDTLALSTWWV